MVIEVCGNAKYQRIDFSVRYRRDARVRGFYAYVAPQAIETIGGVDMVTTSLADVESWLIMEVGRYSAKREAEAFERAKVEFFEDVLPDVLRKHGLSIVE